MRKQKIEMAEEEKKFRVRAENTAFLSVTAFPINLYKQWKKDCAENFGDCHWIKVWHDHEQTKHADKFEELEERVNKLEAKLEGKKEEKKEFVETMGGGKVKVGGD